MKSILTSINLGIAGAGGRGGSFKNACDALESVRVHAVCDRYEDSLDEIAERLGADEKYTDFEDMLEKSELDAVLVGTPMPFHAPQSILALQNNLHVLSEVTAGVSIEECRELVATANTSGGTYMMSENANYQKPVVLMKELVRQGLFGTPYYAEGEYLHELKERDEKRIAARGYDSEQWLFWRRKWQNGVDGVTYGTHSLGPVLQWMPGDRVASVCCAGSGKHYRDPSGEKYAEDTSVMLCKMSSGGLAKIRVDMISDRPHAQSNYQLQGTDGCYESGRAHGEKNRIWLRSKCDDPNTWLDLAELEEAYLPEMWREEAETAAKSGHGGSDYFVLKDFIAAISGEKPVPIGIHEAMDMTLPGLVSQKSISEGGRWLDVPDSREWS